MSSKPADTSPIRTLPSVPGRIRGETRMVHDKVQTPTHSRGETDVLSSVSLSARGRDANNEDTHGRIWSGMKYATQITGGNQIGDVKPQGGVDGHEGSAKRADTKTLHSCKHVRKLSISYQNETLGRLVCLNMNTTQACIWPHEDEQGHKGAPCFDEQVSSAPYPSDALAGSRVLSIRAVLGMKRLKPTGRIPLHDIHTKTVFLVNLITSLLSMLSMCESYPRHMKFAHVRERYAYVSSTNQPR